MDANVEVLPGVVIPVADAADLVFAPAEAAGIDLSAMKADIAAFVADPFGKEG